MKKTNLTLLLVLITAPLFASKNNNNIRVEAVGFADLNSEVVPLEFPPSRIKLPYSPIGYSFLLVESFVKKNMYPLKLKITNSSEQQILINPDTIPAAQMNKKDVSSKLHNSLYKVIIPMALVSFLLKKYAPFIFLAGGIYSLRLMVENDIIDRTIHKYLFDESAIIEPGDTIEKLIVFTKRPKALLPVKISDVFGNVIKTVEINTTR